MTNQLTQSYGVGAWVRGLHALVQQEHDCTTSAAIAIGAR